MLAKVAFDNAIAHKIEAGSDMFLMPSRYEPCGLNQIYSLKYGTVPIVRATGGLDDTIEPWDARTGKGTGFKFSDYTGEALLATIKQALARLSRSSVLADADAQRHEPRFFLGSIGPRVRQDLRACATGASQRGGCCCREELKKCVTSGDLKSPEKSRCAAGRSALPGLN